YDSGKSGGEQPYEPCARQHHRAEPLGGSHEQRRPVFHAVVSMMTTSRPVWYPLLRMAVYPCVVTASIVVFLLKLLGVVFLLVGAVLCEPARKFDEWTGGK